MIGWLAILHSFSIAPGRARAPAILERNQRLYESGLGLVASSEIKGTVAYAPHEEFKVTANNVPVKLNVDKFDLDGTWTLETSMSQDDWIGNWVPSS